MSIRRVWWRIDARCYIDDIKSVSFERFSVMHIEKWIRKVRGSDDGVRPIQDGDSNYKNGGERGIVPQIAEVR